MMSIHTKPNVNFFLLCFFCVCVYVCVCVRERESSLINPTKFSDNLNNLNLASQLDCWDINSETSQVHLEKLQSDLFVSGQNMTEPIRALVGGSYGFIFKESEKR